ncbi:MAG: DNA/RNA nuclease SfsA [Myxococcales bacterium]|nr:DNA/RNA nuclease SfsA [Myxococcales bacterium]
MGRQQRRTTPHSFPPVAVPVDASLRGRLIRRYKRFLVDIVTEDGRELTVHCPDPGSMHGCLREGASVRCSLSNNPRRKLPYSLEMIRVGRIWVGVNTARANSVVSRALEMGVVPELAGYGEIRREVAAGDRSRLDFRLSHHPQDPRPAWLEVKSVTLADGRKGLFPDSVSERATRHLETLMRLKQRGERAVLLFLVQRADCDSVSPAAEIDPVYTEALRRAESRGVELFALGARVTARAITVERRLPVLA